VSSTRRDQYATFNVQLPSRDGTRATIISDDIDSDGTGTLCGARMVTRRWLFTLVEALLISWVLLFLATYFDVPFVREAGGVTKSSAALH
jgi:hypothetical protein